MIEDPDAVADALDVGEHVGREQHGGRAAERRDEVEDVAPALGVEGAHGLVEDDDGRPMDEGAGDPEPLAHAARVGCRAAVGRGAQVDPIQRVVDRRLERGAVEPVQPAQEPQLLAAGHPAVRTRILLEVAEVPPHAERVGGDVERRRRSRGRPWRG